MLDKLSIGIVNTDLCNIKSVYYAFKLFTKKITIINEDFEETFYDILVVPGVGNFSAVMKNLKKKNILNSLIKYLYKGKPSIFICVGLQILFEESEEEGKEKGLGIFRGKVKKIPRAFENQILKVPFVGWNKVNFVEERNKKIENLFYFTHSYYADPQDKKIVHSTANYNGFDYCTSIKYNKILATQFHPEKSANNGIELLKFFCIDSV